MPGLFVLWLIFQRRRRSSFIDGCGPDAEEIAQAVTAHLGGHAKKAA